MDTLMITIYLPTIFEIKLQNCINCNSKTLQLHKEEKNLLSVERTHEDMVELMFTVNQLFIKRDWGALIMAVTDLKGLTEFMEESEKHLQ